MTKILIHKTASLARPIARAVELSVTQRYQIRDHTFMTSS